MNAALHLYAEQMLDHTRCHPIVACKICGGHAEVYDVIDFHKSCDYSLYPLGLSGIPVMYRKCCDCAFIFTDFFDKFSSNQWREHVYNEEYITVDPDYLSGRPIGNARLIDALLTDRKGRVIGLDYGGGNGQTTALLRGNGWMFDTYDPFGYTDVTPGRQGRYDFCSAFEVFEHSPDPVASLKDMVDRATGDRLTILIGTSVHDGAVSDGTRLSWWYAAPRNGHISLFSRRSMHVMAGKLGLNYTPLRGMNGTHLLTRGIGDGAARAFLLKGKARLKMRDVGRRLKLGHAIRGDYAAVSGAGALE